jgi:hypothetical protein
MAASECVAILRDARKSALLRMRRNELLGKLLQRDFADQGAGGAFGFADHPQGR